MNCLRLDLSAVRVMIVLQYLSSFLLAVGATATASLLPSDAMLPLYTPVLSTKRTIWDEPFEEIEPGVYEIDLLPDYTLREHFETIGKVFMRPQIFCINDHIADPEIHDYDGYKLRDPDPDDIDLIRRDPRVKHVGLVSFARGIDDAVELERWAALDARLEQERLERERIKEAEARSITEQKGQRNEL